VPEADEAVDRWREQTCNSKPSQGVPAHITVVFPFAPVDETVIASLTEIFAAVPGFEFALRRAARFPDTLYLAPEPAEEFVRLIEAVVRRFPAYPPYEGAYETVIPHLTVAQGDEAVLRDAERAVGRLLPIRAVAREAVLLEEVEPDGARWQIRRRLPLAAV
jgi:2'-5' RNA ligase